MYCIDDIHQIMYILYKSIFVHKLYHRGHNPFTIGEKNCCDAWSPFTLPVNVFRVYYIYSLASCKTREKKKCTG